MLSENQEGPLEFLETEMEQESEIEEEESVNSSVLTFLLSASACVRSTLNEAFKSKRNQNTKKYIQKQLTNCGYLRNDAQNPALVGANACEPALNFSSAGENCGYRPKRKYTRRTDKPPKPAKTGPPAKRGRKPKQPQASTLQHIAPVEVQSGLQPAPNFGNVCRSDLDTSMLNSSGSPVISASNLCSFSSPLNSPNSGFSSESSFRPLSRTSTYTDYENPLACISEITNFDDSELEEFLNSNENFQNFNTSSDMFELQSNQALGADKSPTPSSCQFGISNSKPQELSQFDTCSMMSPQLSLSMLDLFETRMLPQSQFCIGNQQTPGTSKSQTQELPQLNTSSNEQNVTQFGQIGNNMLQPQEPCHLQFTTNMAQQQEFEYRTSLPELGASCLSQFRSSTPQTQEQFQPEYGRLAVEPLEPSLRNTSSASPLVQYYGNFFLERMNSQIQQNSVIHHSFPMSGPSRSSEHFQYGKNSVFGDLFE